MSGQEAFERGLEALARREHTSAELATWLRGRGFDPGAVADAVDRLTADRALDDERFAAEFAADKRELRGWGPERIRDALRERGVGEALIEAALDADGRETQLERAVELLCRRGRPARDERSRSSALAFLARRGYDSELAYDAVRSYERVAA